MRNLVVALALLACSPLCWQPLRGDTPSVRKEANSKDKSVSADSPSKAATNQRGTKDSPLFIDAEGHQQTPAEAKEKAREKEVKDKIDTRTLISAEITAGATVVLMLVGIGGVIAAIRTLRAIEKQVNVMESQTELTQAQFYQCVYINNWRIEKPWPTVLRVMVDLINPTGFPITLADGYMQFKQDGPECRIAERTFLPPNIPYIR